MNHDDDWTEVVDADIHRMDLVGKGANGTPFLLVKAQDGPAGLVDADTVRNLIAKTAPPREDTTVTAITGTPDQVAKTMHAIHAAAARAKDQTMPAVIKADDADQAADVVANPDEELPDADEVAAATPETAPGDPDDPTSAAWEAVDAARARQALELTIALQRLVEQAADREAQEVAVSGDPDDADNVWTLGDVSSAIDAIVGMLAPFAVTEQAEADQLTAVTKAGRTLSSANEAKIRGAADALTQVLNTLPAPADDAAPVAKTDPKEATMADTDTTAAVTKAKGDPMTPVYDENGKLVGMIDSSDLIAIAPASAATDSDGDTPDAETPADAATDTTPDATAAPADAADTAAAPAPAEDAATIPGTDTVQSPAPTEDTTDVTKSVAAQLEEALAPLAKELARNAELATMVEGLQEQVRKMGLLPDDRQSPSMNGATGVAGLATRDGSPADPLEPLQKAVAEATDPVLKLQAQTALAHAAILQRFQNRA